MMLMRNIRAVLLVLATIGLVTPSAAAFGQCVMFGQPEESFARADAVFVGTVIAREPTGVRGEHVIVDVATFRLERSWKGIRDREVRVGSDEPFEVGKKYLVFAFGKLGEPLTTSILCQWTELIDGAKTKLDWLSTRLSQPLR
jgi:hypothetical protein